MSTAPWIFLLLACFLPVSAAPPKPLEKLENCTFVPTPWADGDSFQIKKPDGKLMTIRLYAADCLETDRMGPMSDTDTRRLRAQRRYFGITSPPSKAHESIDLAKDFGKQAAVRASTFLAKPFTIHTRMQKALGDGRHERFYAFVETSDKKDLATELVRTGLARAYGVSAGGPDNQHCSDVSLRPPHFTFYRRRLLTRLLLAFHLTPQRICH